MKKVLINSTIQKRILKLAIDFCEDSMIPGRYKPQKDQKRKKQIIREDSKVERYFQNILEEWTKGKVERNKTSPISFLFMP